VGALCASALFGGACSKSLDSAMETGGHAGGTSPTGHAGTTGTAATTGAAGTFGTGGMAGGPSPLGCQVSDVAPGDPLIADFSASDGGVATLAIGGTFTYPTPGPTATVTDGALHVTATTFGMASAQYWGAGIYFNGNAAGTDCVNGSAHTGIQFDIIGSVGGTGCSIQFAINDSVHSSNMNDPKGAGPVGSYSPQLAIMIQATPTTMMVPFAGPGAPTGGSPAVGVDPTKLTSVQWQLTTAAAPNGCALDITIDNVKFY
jgi:hypothetical protein